MKKTTLGTITLALFALLAVFAFGCSKNKTATGMATETAATSLASNPMVAGLTSSLGLTSTQASGGAGALLGLAQESLAKEDWSKIASTIPGASSLISEAKKLGGISKFGSLAALAPAFTKMGLSPDQVTKLTPAVTEQVTKAAGADLGAKFGAAMK
jgi:Protein of unknown function VcgC/VcgE (DUF2780)